MDAFASFPSTQSLRQTRKCKNHERPSTHFMPQFFERETQGIISPSVNVSRLPFFPVSFYYFEAFIYFFHRRFKKYWEVIKCPKFVGKGEIRERERIKQRITDFNIFIKYQSNFMMERREFASSAFPVQLAVWGRNNWQKLFGDLLLPPFSLLLSSLLCPYQKLRRRLSH